MGLEKIKAELKAKSGFRASILDRGEKRVRDVAQVANDQWEVMGRPELGDEFESYTVTLVRDPFTQSGWRYLCSCYEHRSGRGRRRKLCSHALAVILWRRHNNFALTDNSTGDNGERSS